MDREVRLELLVGRKVLARNGRSIGRIEEVQAGDHGEIASFLTGGQALLERLSLMGLFARQKSGYRVRWDQLDLSDPQRPRLSCTVRELERL